MKKILAPRTGGLDLPRLPLIPTLLALAATGTVVSQATEATFKYFRFTPTKNFNTTTTTAIQLSEFTFGYRGTILNVRNSTGAGPAVNMSPTGGSNAPNAGEGIEKMFDGSVQTKMFSANRGPFVFAFDNPVTIDSYNFATANDSNDRTPVSWTLEGSHDGLAYVTIDTRNDVGIANTYRTFQAGWQIPGGTALPVFSAAFELSAPAQTNPITYAVASPGIVKTTQSTTLAWTVTGTNPAGTTLTPGPTALADSGTQAITPAAGLTTYTLSATNGAGTSSNPVSIRAVDGGTATFRYFRFTPLSLRNNATANSIQVGEFEFFNGGVKEVSVPTVTNPGGNFPGGEPPSALVDNNPATKWLDFNKQPVIFDFPAPITMDSYQLVTGGDATERDPVAWVIEGSSDLTNWTLVDAVGGSFPSYPTPTRRRTATGILPISGRNLIWKNDADGNWDTTTANFHPKTGDASSTTFGSGDPVRFIDGPAITNVALAAPVAPSNVAFENVSSNYTLSGSSITGNTRLLKSGAGTLTLSAPNSFTGAVTIAGGTVVAETAHSLGADQSISRLTLDGGSTLAIKVAQSSQRPVQILTGGATIDVESGNTLTKVGRFDFNGKLTKTGGGTLRIESYTGSTAAAAEDLVIDEGTVDFGTSYYANGTFPFGTTTMLITVNDGGSLRLGDFSPLAGHHTLDNNSVEQIRLIGGSMEVTSGLTYFSTGLVSGQGRLVLQGGLISGGGTFEPVQGTSAATVTTISAMASGIPSQIVGSGALALNPGNLTLITEPGSILEVSRLISGGYGITKEGTGELILTNANTYAGTTARPWNPVTGIGTDITAGTLTVNNLGGSATGTSAVKIAAGAKLQGSGAALGAVTIAGSVAPGDSVSPVGELKLGSTTLTGTLDMQVEGAAADKLSVFGTLNVTGATLNVTGTLTEPTYQLVYSAGGITGTFASQTIPSGYTLQYSANAIALVSNGASPYQVWSAGLSDTALGADPDLDGVVNALEFILNSDGAVSSTADLPDVTTNPAGDLIFTFVRKSSSTYLGAVVEHSTSLAGDSWTTFAGATVQTNTPGAGLDTVTAVLPASLAGPGQKIFARLKVEIP